MLAWAAQGTLSRHPHLPGRAVRRHRRGLRPAVLGGTAAERGDPAHPAPAWCTIHRCPRGQASVWGTPELLCPRLNRHIGRRVEPRKRWGTPRVPARPQVVQEVDEAALTRASRRCWSLLFLRRRREQRRSFPRWRAGRRIFCLILFLVPTFSKKEQFPFPPGSQVHGTTVCDALLPHSRPRPILPVAKKVRFGDDIPPHESWTGLCTSSRSRCWCTGAWSNAFSPRIGLQRSTWRMLTFTFRSFCDTDVSTVCVRRSGMAIQGPPLRALPVSPCVHEVVEGALTPLREVGVRILNYLDDWLILAQSREQLGDHRDLVLRHLSQLGLRVNWEKSKLSPVQRISFLGVELDSVSMTARLMEERAQAVLNCLSSFKGRNVVPLKQFQRLLGHRASAAAVTPLGLLHMRPLQHWLHSRVPRWA